MTNSLKSILLFGLLFLMGACMSAADSARGGAEPPRGDTCSTKDPEGTCMATGEGACCYAATIKYEYEMLEARSQGDDQAARVNERRYLDFLRRACDDKHEQACKDLASSAA